MLLLQLAIGINGYRGRPVPPRAMANEQGGESAFIQPIRLQETAQVARTKADEPMKRRNVEIM